MSELKETQDPAPDGTERSRAYTVEEVREQFLDTLRTLVSYWDRLDSDHTQRERMEGLVFSILNIFDGTSMSLPAFDLSLAPHPDDKEYHRDNGENWYEPGMVVNDCYLHEIWYKKKR